MIYHRGERRVRRVLRRFQPLFGLSGASAFSVCSAVKFKDIPISLQNSSVLMDIGNWTFESTHGSTAIDWIAEGTTLYSGAYCTYTPFYRWLDNSEEAIILKLQMTRNS